eukprot:gb/GECG01009368.1/.p1 GENE.gb/GECG01009368.1/~~gb/GECG01009368.1/.p1  ORF type:complete len:808 (+),score=107.66 gb/GECG01009368.1/:1-2424(+)
MRKAGSRIIMRKCAEAPQGTIEGLSDASVVPPVPGDGVTLASLREVLAVEPQMNHRRLLGKHKWYVRVFVWCCKYAQSFSPLQSEGMPFGNSGKSTRSTVKYRVSSRGNEGSSRMSPSELAAQTAEEDRDEQWKQARMRLGKPTELMRYRFHDSTPRSRQASTRRISQKSVSLGQRLYERGTEMMTHRKSLGKQDRSIEEANAIRPVTPRSVQTGARLYMEGMDLRRHRDEHAAKLRAAEEGKEDWICPECTQWCHPDDQFCKHPCKYGRVLWNQRDHRTLHQDTHITDTELTESSSNVRSADVKAVLREIRNNPDGTDWVRVCGTERPPEFHLSKGHVKFPLKKVSDSIQRYATVKKEREEFQEKREAAASEIEFAACTFHPHVSKKTENLAFRWRGKSEQSAKEPDDGDDADDKQVTEYRGSSLFQRLYEEKPGRLCNTLGNTNASTLHRRRLTEAMRAEVHRRLYSEAQRKNQKYSRLLETATKEDPFTGERLFYPSTLPVPKAFRRQKHSDDIHEHLYTSGKLHDQKLSELQQREQEEATYEMSRSKVLPRSSEMLRKMRERTTSHLFVLLHRTTQLSEDDKALIENLEHNPSAVSVESATRIIGVLSGMTAPPTAAEIKKYVPQPVPVSKAWISILAEPLPSFLRQTIDSALGKEGPDAQSSQGPDNNAQDEEETLSYSCLHDALHAVLRRMDSSSVLSDSHLRPPAYSIFRGSIRTWKKHSHGTQDEATFEPHTDPQSRRLAMSTREHAAESNVYNRLYMHHIQHEENIQRIRESLEEQWKSEHPFRPALNKVRLFQFIAS